MNDSSRPIYRLLLRATSELSELTNAIRSSMKYGDEVIPSSIKEAYQEACTELEFIEMAAELFEEEHGS